MDGQMNQAEDEIRRWAWHIVFRSGALLQGEKMKKIVAVYLDEAKLAEQKKAELEKPGYRELVIQMTYTKQGGS